MTMPVYAGDLFDEEATVLIKEHLGQLGIKLNIQKMPISQKRSLMTKKQVDMAVYDWRPWVPDAATSSTGTGSGQLHELLELCQSRGAGAR